MQSDFNFINIFEFYLNFYFYLYFYTDIPKGKKYMVKLVLIVTFLSTYLLLLFLYEGVFILQLKVSVLISVPFYVFIPQTLGRFSEIILR